MDDRELLELKYRRHGHRYAYDLPGEWGAEDDLEQMAEAAAHDYWDNHDGFEARWPLTFEILLPDGGLIVSAANAEWSTVTITRDMAIYSGVGEGEQNQRPYAMLSESEKWRADAMIAEAVAHISGLKLLVLDRFDVLDTKGREDLLYWLDGMAADGDIDTALIFGTLNALPALNFDTIDAFWIENGATGHIKQAA